MLNHGTIFAPAAERGIRQRKSSRWAERGARFLLIVSLGFHVMPRSWKT
jgi:hypothetical protein